MPAPTTDKATGLLRTSALAAMASAIVMMAIPSQAFAQDRGDRARSGNRGGQMQAQQSGRGSDGWQGRSSSRSDNRGDNRGDSRGGYRGERGGAQTSSRSAPATVRIERGDDGSARRGTASGYREPQQRQSTAQYPISTAQPTPAERRRDAVRSQARAPYGGDYRQQRGDDRAERRSGSWQRDGANRDRDWERNRSYRDDNRNRSYRDQNRYENQRRDAARDNRSWRDNRSDRDNRSYRDNRRWDRDWRRNTRYNWSHYRATNRHIYRVNRYYAPYNSYSYRRLNIGFTLGSLFYSSRYWITNPWYYRLPEVYGPYRWVRYYNDVLLVDTYSGEVVDVIHDFFW